MSNAMRDSQNTSRLLLTVAAIAIGVLLSPAPVLANDDDEPVREEGFIANLMRGLGGSDGSNGINYRERSPLVVPPSLALPPPEKRRPDSVANWPKDPDVMERRAAREALRKRDRAKEQDPQEAIKNPALPELGQARARTATVAPQPGVTEERRIINEGGGILSPSQLGVPIGNLFGMFGVKRNDDVPFTAEPSRQSLTQPPAGYQTPAANQAYGITDTERAKLLNRPTTGDDPSGILPPGKF
jgi:hypothetical protein